MDEVQFKKSLDHMTPEEHERVKKYLLSIPQADPAPYLQPSEVNHSENTLEPLLPQSIQKKYEIKQLSSYNGINLEYIVASGDIVEQSYAVFSWKALNSLLKIKREHNIRDILNWTNKYGFLDCFLPRINNDANDMFHGITRYPLIELCKRISRLQNIWRLIDQIAKDSGDLLESVKSLPRADLIGKQYWYSIDKVPHKALGENRCYVLALCSRHLTFPIKGTEHYTSSISESEKKKLLLYGISTLILDLTHIDRRYVPKIEPSNGIFPYKVCMITGCLSPESYFLLLMLQLLSTSNQKICPHCHHLFIPDTNSQRPGKQKYCQSCKNYGSKETNRAKYRSAIQAVKQQLMTVTEAATEYHVTVNRLESLIAGTTKL